MKIRLLPLTLLILLVPTLAFAQAAPPAPTTLTTMAMVIMIINIVVGFIGQGIGQGNVLGIVTVPKAYVPYLTVLAAFGTSVGAALSQGDAVLPAILFAFLGLATGTGLSHHFGTPARTQSMTDGNSGKPPASGGTTADKKDAVSSAADKLAPPAAHRGFLKAGLLGLASAVLVVCAVMLSGCNQPVLPVFEQVVAVVEQDIQNNVSDSQMASDVCKAMGGTATTDAVCAGVEVVIQDAVQLLIDSGVLSGNSLARAKSYMGDHPKTTVTVTAPAGGK